MIRRVVLVAALCATAGFATAYPIAQSVTAAHAATCQTPRPYMMAFGDSKTWGINYGSNTSPLNWLDNRLKTTGQMPNTWWVGSQNNGFADLEAYPGVTAETMVARIGPAVDKYHPDYVLIDLGTNDAFNAEPETIRDRLRVIVETAMQHDACVRIAIAQTAINWNGTASVAGGRMIAANKLLPQMAASLNALYGNRIRVVDMQRLDVVHGDYGSDRMHLSSLGNDIESCFWYYGMAPLSAAGRLPATLCPVPPNDHW